MARAQTNHRRRQHIMRGLPEDFPSFEVGDIIEPRGFSLVQFRDEREVAIAMRAIALAREHFTADSRTATS